MHAIAGLLVLNLAFVSCGYGVLAALGRPPSAADAGLAFCGGMAALVLSCCLLAVVGYVPGVPVILALAALGTMPVFLRGWRPRRPAGRLPGVGAVAAALLAALAVAYSIATVAVGSVKFLDEWDAWSMWTLKAKGLIVFGNLPAADFAGSAHPDYPIFVPMLQSLTFRFIGSFDTQLLHVEHALLPIAFAGAVVRLLQRRLPSGALAVIGLVLVAAPGIARNVPDALADVPVAVFVALAGLSLALWLDSGERTLPLFVLFASAAMWTKDEGLASIAAMSLVALPLAVRRPYGRRLLPLVAAVVAVVVAYLPWHIWKAVEGATYDTALTQGVSFGFFSERGHAAVQAIDAMWSQLGAADIWLGVPYLLLAVAVLAIVTRRQWRLAIFGVAAPLLSFLLYVWVYAIRSDPLGLSWTLDTTVTRVTTSVGLLSTTLLAVLLGVFDRTSDE